MEKLQISLTAARVNANLTQEAVAKIMNVDRSTVRRWERGEKVPDFDKTKELSHIYGIPLDNIFFGNKSRKKREK